MQRHFSLMISLETDDPESEAMPHECRFWPFSEMLSLGKEGTP